VVGWQNRPHEGLRHPRTPGLELSPNEMYAALVSVAGYVPVVLSGDDYIELLPVAWRAINYDGIHIDYRTYDSPDLGPYRRQPSPTSAKKGLWEVHHDPYDLSRVWVRRPRAGSSPQRGAIWRAWRRLLLISPGARPGASPPPEARTPLTRPPWPGSSTSFCIVLTPGLAQGTGRLCCPWHGSAQPPPCRCARPPSRPVKRQMVKARRSSLGAGRWGRRRRGALRHLRPRRPGDYG